MQSTSDLDHYKALGVSKDASQDDIRKAYKKLAKEWHPDKNLNIRDSAEKKFKEISEAHRVLSDGHKRYEYDRQRENAKRDLEFQEERRRRENIRRMDKEQKDYVRRQEEKRRKAQRMRAAYPGDTSQPFGDTDKTFRNFFEDRDKWESTAPDLFASEQKEVRNMMMSDILNMSHNFGFERGESFQFSTGFSDSSNINRVFDCFFSDNSFAKFN